VRHCWVLVCRHVHAPNIPCMRISRYQDSEARGSKVELGINKALQVVVKEIIFLGYMEGLVVVGEVSSSETTTIQQTRG